MTGALVVPLRTLSPLLLTRRQATSVTARIYDLKGTLAPLTLRLRYDLRKLIKNENLDWDDAMSSISRERWCDNFQLIDDVRDIMYLRTAVPEDAKRLKCRMFVLGDGAETGLMVAAFCGFEKKSGEFSCINFFAKGLLGQEHWTIPVKELHALSVAADCVVLLKNALGDWLEDIYVAGDSRIALAWTVYEKVKLDILHRNRVSNIRSKVDLNTPHHVEGKENVSDIGTRPDLVTSDIFCPGSEWMNGRPWMKQTYEHIIQSGILKSVSKIKLENDEKR